MARFEDAAEEPPHEATADGPRSNPAADGAPDASDPDVQSKLLNDFLLGLFVPAILLFCAVWVALTLWGDALLAGTPFAASIEPQDGYGAVAGGWPRFLLVVVATAVLVVPYLAFYARVVRPRLVERGLVTERLT